MLLKSGLFFTLCLFTLQASQIKGKNPGWDSGYCFSIENVEQNAVCVLAADFSSSKI